MSTPSTILAYVPDDGRSGGMSDCLPDFAHNQLYFLSEGTDQTQDAIRQFTGYVSGDETLSASLGTLGIPGIATGGKVLTYSGYLVFNENASNSTTMSVVKASTLTLVNRFGVSSGSLSPSGSGRILYSGSMAPMRCAGIDFLLTCALHNGEMCVLSVPTMQLVNLGAADEALSLCGPGAIGTPTANGTAYALGIPSDTTAALGLYKISVGTGALSATRTKIGTIAVAAIDATWTHINAAYGITYDQTDGNLIISVQTSDVVTNQFYLVKVNAVTAAVMWQYALNAAPTGPMSRNLVTTGTLYMMSSVDTLNIINTATGVGTAAVVSILGMGGDISEDAAGSVIAVGGWAESATHPTYVGTWMGTDGNHGLTSKWARYFPGAFNPPAPPPAIYPGIVNIINRAWTYVQDGHTFYVIDLDTQGTFAYDTSTSMWNELQTNGVGWNMKNGVMWGQRVVAGDPATGDVWELDPGTVTDAGGLYEIYHAVTGIIPARGRTYHSCDAVRVAASFGLVGDNGATFNLRFSDDGGSTWSAYYPIILTAGQTFADLAWRSLGSFREPGRVFEFSDSGGLIRIDGADAFIDGFDEKEPTPGRQ